MVQAQLALSEAERELRGFQAELAWTEAAKHKPDSMEGFASSLGQDIGDTKSGGIVPGDLIGQAEAHTHMQALMVGHRAISVAVQEHAAAQARKRAVTSSGESGDSMIGAAKRQGDAEAA